MVDRARTSWKVKRGLYFLAEFGEVTVDTNDTVTFDTIDDAAGSLIRAHFIRKSTGAIVACTEATNIATISTAGLVDVPCVYIAYGVKA